MALKFFCIYIGSFLAFSIVLVAIAKQFAEGFSASGKKPIVWGSFSSVVISGGAYLSSLITDHLFTVFWFFTAIFLIFGIIHIVFFHNKYFRSNKEDKNRVLLGEILFCISLMFFTIVIFSSLQYFLKDKSFLFYPMLMSMLAFFIPLSVLNTFEAAYSIPAAEFNIWQYPLNDPIELPDEKAGEKVLVIAFEIAKKKADMVKTNFRAKGPETMKLGDLYYHFINDYNDVQSETPIRYADDDLTTHEWWFRVKPKWYQLERILDPELSIRENRIKENTIIICERIENDSL
ncbi:MAG: TssN family type VI secretion system protein [Ginsengibacter sp.]